MEEEISFNAMGPSWKNKGNKIKKKCKEHFFSLYEPLDVKS